MTPENRLSTFTARARHLAQLVTTVTDLAAPGTNTPQASRATAGRIASNPAELQALVATALDLRDIGAGIAADLGLASASNAAAGATPSRERLQASAVELRRLASELEAAAKSADLAAKGAA